MPAPNICHQPPPFLTYTPLPARAAGCLGPARPACPHELPSSHVQHGGGAGGTGTAMRRGAHHIPRGKGGGRRQGGGGRYVLEKKTKKPNASRVSARGFPFAFNQNHIDIVHYTVNFVNYTRFETQASTPRCISTTLHSRFAARDSARLQPLSIAILQLFI